MPRLWSLGSTYSFSSTGAAEVRRMLDPEEAEQRPVLLGDPDLLVLADARRDRRRPPRRARAAGRPSRSAPDEQPRQRLDLFLPGRVGPPRVVIYDRAAGTG